MLSVGGLKDGEPTNYASQVSYEAHGGLKSVALGNNLVESWSYIPSRQQPWKIQLGTVAQPSSVEELLNDYCPSTPFLGASCASNNGNVMGQRRGSLGAATTVYTYDYLNRLLSATESGNGPGYSRTYGYDGFGNGWVASNSGVVLSSFTPTAKTNFGTDNRLYINNAAYNDSGNQTAIGGYTFKWDGENRMVESVIGGVTTAYVYDGEGRRVKKVKTTTAPATTTETRYVYNASGTLAAEYGPAEPESDTEYFMADHLGSTRLVTRADGTPKRALDYLPFGEEIPQGVSGRGALYPADGATPTSGKKFTGHYRDSETGLDYFGARYLSGVQGRFTSPDKPFADQNAEDPQRWNLYPYGRNNPLKYIDPDGNSTITFNGEEKKIYLYSHDGKELGSWDAGNNVVTAATIGKMEDGEYEFLDTKSPHGHGNATEDDKTTLQDSEDGRYGAYGIFRVKPFTGADGKKHYGVGLHSGRANKKDARGRTGVEYCTLGCMRTTDAAMKKIAETAKIDQLTKLKVEKNREKRKDTPKPKPPPRPPNGAPYLPRETQ